MSVTGIILAAVIVGGTGLFIGVFLGVAGKKFAVEVDEREAAVLEALPGNKRRLWRQSHRSQEAVAVVMPDVPDLQQQS